SDDGHLEIDLRVSARSPFELGGTAAVARRRAGDEWTANATVSGSLARTAVVEAVASARGARATATALIAAFEPLWLKEFLVTVHDADPAAFDARLPHGLLRIDATGTGRMDGLPAGRVQITNRLPGMLAAGRMPVVSMSAAYRLAEGQLDFPELRASLGAGGSVA